MKEDPRLAKCYEMAGLDRFNIGITHKRGFDKVFEIMIKICDEGEVDIEKFEEDIQMIGRYFRSDEWSSF